MNKRQRSKAEKKARKRQEYFQSLIDAKPNNTCLTIREILSKRNIDLTDCVPTGNFIPYNQKTVIYSFDPKTRTFEGYIEGMDDKKTIEKIKAKYSILPGGVEIEKYNQEGIKK